MKGTFLIAILVVFSMLAIPLASLDSRSNAIISTANPQNNILYEKNEKTEKPQKIKVLKDGQISEYDINDYIFGVVAAEMPALYEKEALKAQAVAAYTFALYKKETASSDYDITSDPKTAQCFITREEAAERWGEKAEEYAKKIDECIAEVKGQSLSYDQKPIFAAFHAISSGTTNNCADVWGSDLPYLKSVDSVGDRLANGYLSEVTFTAEELAEKLKSVTSASGEPTKYFSDIKSTDNGYVKEIKYCGKALSGSQLCELLGLRSANFEVKFADEVFTFNVKGYGHGVGMSQTGADYMAKQGSTYEEILLHYYTDAKLQKN